MKALLVVVVLLLVCLVLFVIAPLLAARSRQVEGWVNDVSRRVGNKGDGNAGPPAGHLGVGIRSVQQRVKRIMTEVAYTLSGWCRSRETQLNLTAPSSSGATHRNAHSLSGV